MALRPVGTPDGDDSGQDTTTDRYGRFEFRRHPLGRYAALAREELDANSSDDPDVLGHSWTKRNPLT